MEEKYWGRRGKDGVGGRVSFGRWVLGSRWLLGKDRIYSFRFGIGRDF